MDRLKGWRRWLGERIELSTLLAALAAAGAVWGFVALAGEVVEGDTKGLDRDILLWLRNPADISDPRGPLWLEETARDITATGSLVILSFVTLAAAGFLWLRGNRRTMIVTVVGIFSGFLTNQLLKFFFERPRPDLVPHGDIVYTASFPSGHAMMSAITYLTLAILVARVQPHYRLRCYIVLLATFVTVMIGVSRVYLGVHWPSDVLAGWTAGAAWALLWWLLANWLERRGGAEPGFVESPGDGHRPSLPTSAPDESLRPAGSSRR